MTVGIAGHGSAIAREFMKLLPRAERAVCERLADMPSDLDHYLVCAGHLEGWSLMQISDASAQRTWLANFIEPARFCDRALLTNPKARICVIGSESGFLGSYDMAYAGAKAALHLYVETKRLTSPHQQLVCIAPTIISDAGMTQRRDDVGKLGARAAHTRHGRWLEAREVAELAHHALFAATPFLSNTVIRLRAAEGE